MDHASSSASWRLLLYLVRKLGLLESTILYPKVHFGELEITIPILKGVGIGNIYGSHERWMHDIYRAIMASKEGAVVDVGANLGQTLFTFLHIDRLREYVGFEPDIGCCFYLQEIIQCNNLKTHTVIPSALSNESRVGQLWFSSEYDSSASVIESFRPCSHYSGSKNVLQQLGDDALLSLNLSDMALIKVDAEGGELEVLEGLRETIRKYRPYLILEVLPTEGLSAKKLDTATSAFRKTRIERLETLLQKTSYVTFKLSADNAIQAVSCLQPRIESGATETNYLAVPSETLSEFRLKLREHEIDELTDVASSSL